MVDEGDHEQDLMETLVMNLWYRRRCDFTSYYDDVALLLEEIERGRKRQEAAWGKRRPPQTKDEKSTAGAPH